MLKGTLLSSSVQVLYLVGSADEVQVVAVEELADHISSKGEGDAPVVFSPALDVLVWVRPQQVTEEAWKETQTHNVNWILVSTLCYPERR